jgi:outer membrane protein assembly factor BamB
VFKGVNSIVAASMLAGGCLSPPRVAPVQEAGEWPMAMGGVERAGYAGETVPDRVDIAWREGVGRGITAPLLVAGDVVLAATTSRSLVSLNAGSGSQYWDHRFGAALAGPPLRRGRTVYVSTRDRESRTFALDMARGRRQWSRRVGPARTDPLLHGGTLFVTTEARELVALETGRGEIRWRTRFGAAAAVAPVPFGDDVLVVTAADSVYRVDAERGTIEARGALPATPVAPLVVRGDTLVAALHSGTVVALHVPDMRVLWTADVGAPILAPPAATDAGAVYVLARDASVWRITDAGRDVRRIAALGGAATGSLTLARDRLLVGRLDGALFLLDVDGDIIWRMDLDDSIVASVSVHGGAVFVPLMHGDVVKLQ